MQKTVEVGEKVDLVWAGRTQWRKTCHRLMRPTGVEETEAPGRMCCCRPKSINRVVMANYVSKSILFEKEYYFEKSTFIKKANERIFLNINS